MVLVASLALAGLAGCATEQQMVSQREDHLAAAGFVVKPADTPERQAMLNRLPPHHFVTRTHDKTVTYVYADPLVCDCMYVGSQQAYDRYRQYVEQKKLADERELTADMYNDPQWNWAAWGPWGPEYGPMYGPGYGW